MEKLLTIVVPAYNVEKYIKNCLDCAQKSGDTHSG